MTGWLPPAIGWVARAAGVATLVAGLVGVARQRAEAQQIRRGLRPPSARVVHDLPARAYGPVSRRLATWVPSAPRTGIGRVASLLWAAPLTLVGVTLALLSGRLPVWDRDLGCLVTRQVGGPSRAALQAVGAHANAVGHVVLARDRDPSPVLLAHEAVHVRQAERLGPLLVPAYLWLGALHGYRDHPLERAARLAAVRASAAAERPAGHGPAGTPLTGPDAPPTRRAPPPTAG
jgi:hypothetical protein